ncbi:unnamed protein product [Peronospora farinosa]|uniref:Uncharacterized protein n=1 Tax=Peronospora farinosa TaxID=134698 RepID=A0AAV0SXH3_9STRA|nr:unnamed protein product [Peronospora farinosa]CAI5707781.1 unnamed protein product [Peronospora farinosa]
MQQLLMTQETGGAKDDAGKEYTMQPYPSKPKRLMEAYAMSSATTFVMAAIGGRPNGLVIVKEDESDPLYHKANRGLKKNMEEWRLMIL